MAADLKKGRIILMDGATFTYKPPLNIEIKRQISRNMLLEILLLFLAGLVIYGGVYGLLDWLSINFISPLGIIIIVIGLIYLGWFFYQKTPAMQIPDFYWDGNDQLLDITGEYARSIPFEKLSHITTNLSAHGPPGIIFHNFWIHLNDGEEIPLGSISGEAKPMEKTSQRICAIIEEVTGIPTLSPDPGLPDVIKEEG